MDKVAFMADVASQTAARTAVSESMPGVLLEQVIISDVLGIARRRALSMTSNDHHASRYLPTSAIRITFIITITAQQFDTNEGGADELFVTLTNQLENSVSGGTFNSLLSNATAALGATAVIGAVTQGSVTSEKKSVVTTSHDDNESGIDAVYVILIVVIVIVVTIAVVAYGTFRRNRRRNEVVAQDKWTDLDGVELGNETGIDKGGMGIGATRAKPMVENQLSQPAQDGYAL